MALVATVSCTADKVFVNSATITYSCTGHEKPSDSTVTSSSSRKTEYTNYSLKWTFTPGSSTSSNASGTITISGLATGSAVTITGSLTVSYYKKVSTRTYNEEKKEWNSWKTDYEDSKTITLTDSDTVTVYTRPGTFTGFDGKKDQLINDVINSTSAANWNAHCSKYLSWKNQTATTINIAFPSGQLITADWFNSLRTACGSPDTVPVAVKDQTLITADIFKKLGAAISKS